MMRMSGLHTARAAAVGFSGHNSILGSRSRLMDNAERQILIPQVKVEMSSDNFFAIEHLLTYHGSLW